MTLGVEASTGRVLSAAYRGEGPSGAPGDIVEAFSDFRDDGGLLLPFKDGSTFNGEPRAAPPVDLTHNMPIDEPSKREFAKPDPGTRARLSPLTLTAPSPVVDSSVDCHQSLHLAWTSIRLCRSWLRAALGCSPVPLGLLSRGRPASQRPGRRCRRMPRSRSRRATATAPRWSAWARPRRVDPHHRRRPARARARWSCGCGRARPRRGRRRLALRAGRPARAGAAPRLSRALNRVFGRGLSLGVADMSSAMRLYRAQDAGRALDARGSTPCRSSWSASTPKAGGSSRCRSSTSGRPDGASHRARLGSAPTTCARSGALWKLRNSI